MVQRRQLRHGQRLLLVLRTVYAQQLVAGRLDATRVVSAAAVQEQVDAMLAAMGRPAAYGRDTDLGRNRQDAAGAKTWRRDLGVLRQRDLVESGLTDPGRGIIRGAGIRLARCEKPLEMHLSPGEHEALQWARKTCGDDSLPSPTSSDGRGVDLLTRAVRLVEESPNLRLSWRELAEGLARSEWEVRRVLAALDVDVLDDRDAPVNLGVHPAAEDTGSDRPVTIGAELSGEPDCWSKRKSVSPVFERGLWSIGLFAYGPEEVAHRLRLIRDALDSNHPDLPDHQDDLGSAWRKLNDWRDQMRRWRSDLHET